MIIRRDFLKGLTGLAAAASIPRYAQATGKNNIGVVGGGILGATIAYALAEAGARVTLFEKDAPAAGATSKSFAWINAYTSHPHYRALRMKSILAWQKMDAALQLDVAWGGAIHWAENAGDAELMKAEALEFSQAGYDAQIIDKARLSQLAPNVQLGAFHIATFNSMDGHIDPVATTRRIIDVAARAGVEAIYPCSVEGLRFENQRLVGVATSKGNYEVDRLVVAGGVDSPVLLAEAGYTLPMIHAPGILMHSGPTEPVLQRVVESPTTYFKQYRDGRIVGNDGYYAPNIPEHAAILAGPAEMPSEIQAMHGKRIFEAIKAKLPPAGQASYSHLTLGYRPMPGDRMPTVGPVPGNPDVYVAVMHSGVTLAPIMGHYVARELMHGETIRELAPYRPERFS